MEARKISLPVPPHQRRGKRPIRKVAVLLMVLLAAAGAGVWAQAPTPTQESAAPRNPPAWGGYPYPRAYDAEIADGDVHRVLYADDRIMFLEVTNPPGLDVHMHGHPYASVFVRDSGGGGGGAAAGGAGGAGANANSAANTANNATAAGAAAGGLNDAVLDPKSEFNGQGWGNGPPAKGTRFPTCTTSPPQAPHKPINRGMAPLHFYRVEFLRLDGDDIQTHWKDWYPEMTQPAKPVKDLARGRALGPNFSEQWPYPIAYDSINAAPNNYKLLFEDGHLRVLEVTIRPGETTPMHGHPYPSVLAFNAISGDPSLITDKKLDPASPLNGEGAGTAPPPSVFNMKVPICVDMAPQAPHAIHNGGAVPLHYYRVEFKRVDGTDFATHWRQWYPWMQYMKYMR